MSSDFHLVSRSPEDTWAIGRLLGQRAGAGDVFLLTGTLGAGKTCLTQGIAWGLGVEGYARSPTFVIVTQYRGRLTLHHIDLFRISDSQEAQELGLEEYFSGEDVCVVEWADRAPDVFPAESLSVAMGYGSQETERLITIKANNGSYEQFVEDLKQKLPQRHGDNETTG